MKMNKIDFKRAALFAACAILLFVMLPLVVLCKYDGECVRNWLSALSGWAALMAAVPTIYYLRMQVADADRHQRTGFEIELRREKVLAERVIRLAEEAPSMLHYPDGTLRELSPNLDWYQTIVEVLEGDIIERFESEIAVPKVMAGRIVAKIVREGILGNEEKAAAAPTFISSFFEHIREQAQEFLADVRGKTQG